jgi:hypothetical protein
MGSPKENRFEIEGLHPLGIVAAGAILHGQFAIDVLRIL